MQILQNFVNPQSCPILHQIPIEKNRMMSKGLGYPGIFLKIKKLFLNGYTKKI